MKRSCILIPAIFLLACNESRTRPAQFPYQLRMEIHCLAVDATLHCRAVLGRENVTNQASWSISEGNAAAISAPGIVTPAGRGEIEISATYGYHATPVLYLVDPHDPPVELGWLSGQVREDNDSKEPIAHAIVEIVEGDYNQGKSARTDAFGRYRIKYVKTGVSFTARASKAGYEPSARGYRADPRSEGVGGNSGRLDFRLTWKPPG